MQADHQDLEGTGGGQVGFTFAEQGHELVVDDFHDLLARGDALEDVLADALLLDAVHKVPGDLEMHVGGEQRGADLLERVRHVGLGQLADTAKVAEGAA